MYYHISLQDPTGGVTSISLTSQSAVLLLVVGY
jgi:hypothetical protein